jgi:hypothetical protein
MNKQMSKSIIENTGKADLVIVAKVQSVGAGPGVWSGLLAAYQEVRYQTISYLKRRPQEKEVSSIVVFHPVVAKSLTAEPQTPKLKESLFKPGAELILFLKQRNSRLETFDENYGVVPNDQETIALVTKSASQ